MCKTAREILDGEPSGPGGVIRKTISSARSRQLQADRNRHDYPFLRPERIYAAAQSRGLDVVCIGKIASIYDGVGVTRI